MSAGHHLKKWLSKRTYLLCGFIGPLITPLRSNNPRAQIWEKIRPSGPKGNWVMPGTTRRRKS